MQAQNIDQSESTMQSRVNTLIADLEIKGIQKMNYLKLAKNNPQLVIDQLEAFKQYKADFNSEVVDLFIIDSDEF